MSNTVNIYLTYSSTTTDETWLKSFQEKLNMAFSRTIKSEIAWTVKTSDSEFNHSILPEQNLFIAVLEEQKDIDNQYIEELESITNFLAEKNDYNENSLQFIKILRSPNGRVNQPEQLVNHNGFIFYEHHSKINRLVPLDFNNSDQNVKAWKLILDLAFDIKVYLQKGSTSKTKVTTNNNDKVIYLSPCADDLASLRDEFSREISNLGIKVIPDTNIIPDVSSFEQSTIDQLNQCKIAVQLVGAKYGEMLKEYGVSLLEYENNIINNYIEANNNLTRLVWTPDHYKRIESRQEFLVSRIKKQLSDTSRIIHASKDEFKEQLFETISKTYQISTEAIDTNKIYLVTPNIKEAENLKQQIKDADIEVVYISNENGENSYKQHLRFLSQTDHVLILWKNHDTLWLNSKISDLIKAPGLGREKPFKSIGIFTNGITPDLTGYLNWLPEITCFSENNPDDLHSYLARIKEYEPNEQ